MADNTENQNVVRLIPCRPVTMTPGGTARVSEDATLYAYGEDGRVRPWMPPTTPELASPSTSQGRKRTRSSLKSRRALNLSDADIFNVLLDSGSDEDGHSSEGEGVETDLVSLELCRFAAGLERDRLIKEMEGAAVEQELAVPLRTDFLWSDDPTSFSGQKETNNRNPGPTFSATTDPVVLFETFWDRNFMELVVHETNQYAWRHISYYSDPDFGKGIPEYLDSWTEVTVDEMYRYFAVLILMSHSPRDQIYDYWTTGSLGMPEFRQFMPRNRFRLISKFLHFVDNDNMLVRGGHERKVEKVRPIVEHCNRKFAELNTPAQHLSLDESLLLWKGRLSCKQCIRSKAARFGIKSFELCEAESGYMVKYRLYTGKNSDLHPDSLHGFRDHTAKVVLDFMEGYLDVGHVLVMDNWYNQLPLARYLKSRHTDVLGTISRRRIGIPPAIKDLMPKKVKRGQWRNYNI